LKGVARDSYFLTTKIPDGSASKTRSYLQQDLDDLGLDYVDLMLVHYPPRGNSCSAMQTQWAEMETFYKAGKAKAIGVSNFCPSSIECIMQKATVTPAVNQVQYHVGMGVDPIGVKSASEKYGIHLQAYSPLGNGESDLISGDLVTGIGSNYGKTGAQVAMRWIQENGVSLTTKTTKTSHMQQDLDVFSFEFTASDKAQLDAATSPKGKPSFICSSLSATAGVPTHTLNNGIEMPMMSIGTWQYDVSTAEQVVKDAMSVGFTHIDTANNYNNQKGVGAALKGVARDSYFLTTKIPDGSASKTRSYLQQDLDDLGLDYVDLMLVHYPPRGNSCSAMQTQWAEMETFYKAGKAKAIGVSNFCPSSIECIMQKATVTPAVNQVQYHVGMGVDPIGVKSASEKYGIHLQAYSPLGNGESDLISGDLVTGIGSNYGKTGAQVAMRWIQENGVSLTTKTTKTSHMQQDLDVFSFEFTASDKAQLDAATSPSGKPSFMCNSAEVSV